MGAVTVSHLLYKQSLHSKPGVFPTKPDCACYPTKDAPEHPTMLRTEHKKKLRTWREEMGLAGQL